MGVFLQDVVLGVLLGRCGRVGRTLLKVCWQRVVGFERILLWVC